MSAILYTGSSAGYWDLGYLQGIVE